MHALSLIRAFGLHWYILYCPMILIADSKRIHSDTSSDSVSRQQKALIRLHGCAGWSGPLLVAYARRHVFAWCKPYNKGIKCIYGGTFTATTQHKHNSCNMVHRNNGTNRNTILFTATHLTYVFSYNCFSFILLYMKVINTVSKSWNLYDLYSCTTQKYKATHKRPLSQNTASMRRRKRWFHRERGMMHYENMPI